MYYKTGFEDKIERLFISKGILNPSDLSIERLSIVFDIQIVYMPNAPQRAVWDDEFSVVFLDSTKTPSEIREVFFHELAHLLFHEGNQFAMFSDFRNLQENQAKVFQLYASMPFFMIKKLDLPSENRLIIDILSDTFMVTHRLAKKRWHQIKQRIYTAQFLCRSAIPAPNTSKKWSKETLRLLDKLYRQTGVRG
ncbi:ImmA/IrrE family metallo-endopeptidase [Caldalkalibacillus thermarum TA2.A1]|nr:ImmA/IrrE family metallo-endopeptidase [Caldalkalibacillus thermarum]QZT33724.1 ImmA/IrrE family metallo-endopeptidase [Caldalkalibacillus thermarum TA2.A1]